MVLWPITQSGKELSTSHVATVPRMHPGPLVVTMDGDAAGQDSNRCVTNAVTAVGRRVLVTRLPAGEDPASWLSAHGPAGLAVLVVGARPFISGSDESNGADDNVRVGLSW